MLLEILINTERKEGKIEDRIEAIIELLEDLGTIPDDLKTQLESEKDMNTLKVWMKIAARAKTIDQFMKEIQVEQ